MHKPESLRRKSSARLAAVQCLYRQRVMEEALAPEKLAAEYLAQWKDDRESDSRVMSRDAEPDKAFLNKLLAGAVEKNAEIETLLSASLTDKWKMERMSPLLIAILVCAIYELRYHAPQKAAMVIDEYVTLTGRFFEPGEVGFVNGLLDTLSKAT